MEHAGTSLTIANILAVISGPDVAERGTLLNRALIESAEEALDALLSSASLSDVARAKVVINRSYSGSWIIDASLNLWTGASWAFGALEIVSKVPKILEGLSAIENQVKAIFSERLKKISPDASSNVTVVPPSTLQVQSAGLHNINWQAELSNYLGKPNVILLLRQAQAHIRGTLVSVDREFIRMEDDGEDAIIPLAELAGIRILKRG